MRRYAITLATLPLIAIFGCSPPSTQNSYDRDKPTYQANVIKDKRVETDAFLAQKAQVLGIRQTTVSGDLMKISVQIVNNDSWDGSVDYKFEWFDDQGMIVEGPGSTWNTEHFGPQETKSLVSIAPSGRCKDFHLKMQQSQRQ